MILNVIEKRLEKFNHYNPKFIRHLSQEVCLYINQQQNISVAQRYAYQQYDLETVWADSRESNSLILKLSTDEDDNFWDEYAVPAIEKKLNSLHLEEGLKDSLFSEIDADLFNCYLNNKYKKNHPIWNMIEDAYFKGFWPCGWEGKYPEGKLVVFKLNYA